MGPRSEVALRWVLLYGGGSLSLSGMCDRTRGRAGIWYINAAWLVDFWGEKLFHSSSVTRIYMDVFGHIVRDVWVREIIMCFRPDERDDDYPEKINTHNEVLHRVL